jgi:hypothetical protein
MGKNVLNAFLVWMPVREGWRKERKCQPESKREYRMRRSGERGE